MKAKLLVIEGVGVGNSCIVQDNEEVCIGRNPDCDIPVLDPKLSRIHCIIRSVSGGFELLDNNSTNGTYLNDQLIDTGMELKDHDLIRVGGSKIRFAVLDDFEENFALDPAMEVDFNSDIEIEVDSNLVIEIDDASDIESQPDDSNCIGYHPEE